MKLLESHVKVVSPNREYLKVSCTCLFIDPSTEFADCTTGEVRFTDFTDNPEEDSRQGTIQICINKAWGSVCSDNFFDNTDAAVFCQQLPGFLPDGSCFHTLPHGILIYFP